MDAAAAIAAFCRSTFCGYARGARRRAGESEVVSRRALVYRVCGSAKTLTLLDVEFCAHFRSSLLLTNAQHVDHERQLSATKIGSASKAKKRLQSGAPLASLRAAFYARCGQSIRRFLSTAPRGFCPAFSLLLPLFCSLGRRRDD